MNAHWPSQWAFFVFQPPVRTHWYRAAVFTRLRSVAFPRILGCALVLGLAATGCSVATDSVAVSRADRTVGNDSSSQPAGDELPALGPIAGSSHWHAAYVVRVCDDVLEPFDSSDDPLGIHSHGDGIMHVHPFFEESGYEAATLGLFADAMGFEIATGELTLPGGGTWRDGDLCNGEPSRVFVDRWSGPDPESDVVRLFTGLRDIRYLADGELYQIAFAPADSPPVVPPSIELLPQLSRLEAPPAPWVDAPADAAQADVRIWPIGAVDDEPCAPDASPESVTSGAVRCFTPGDTILTAAEAVSAARAVTSNRQPAVELRTLGPLDDLIADHFARSENPFAFAVEIDGAVISAPQLTRPPVGNRLVISGGFSTEAALRLAAAFNN